MNGKSVVRRIGLSFNNEIDKIIKEREEKGMKKITKSQLTDWILKHNSWNLVREDLIYKINEGKKC
jgi:hypothetical protein